MNKIIVDTNKYKIDLKEDTYLIIKTNSLINLKVLENEAINLLIFTKNNNLKIDLELLDNSKLTINNLGINTNIDYDILINNNSNLYIVDSIITNIESINNININNTGNNNIINVYTNGINLKNDKLYFNLNGIIKKDTYNSYLEENSKIINISDGDSKIIPNLIIDSKEVIANHSAYIGNLSKDDLNYLMSRGINKEIAKKLLIKSILISNMKFKDDFIKEIDNFIN